MPPEASSAAPAAAPAASGDDAEDPFWPALRVHAGELVYDYCWYSHASAADPATCCFAVTARSHPVHLYDALTGELRCSYRVYNALDELSPAYSVAFGCGGAKIFAGCHASIHSFDVERPGRECASAATHQRKQDGQPGIISCMAFACDESSSLMGVGSYSGVAALYDARTMEQLFVLEGHAGGVTHVRFSADGNYLYTGARRDGAVYCWDARHASGAVYSIKRETPTTNQRIYFDIEPCGRHLATGGQDGLVRFFDLRDGAEVGSFRAAVDTVNGCEFHPLLPLLATASGQRRFFDAPTDSASEESGSEEGGSDDEDMDSGGSEHPALSADENVLRVWRLGAAAAVVEMDAAAADPAGPE